MLNPCEIKTVNVDILPPFYCSSLLVWFMFGTGVDRTG